MIQQLMLDAVLSALDSQYFVTQSYNSNESVSVLFFGKLGLRVFGGRAKTPPYIELPVSALAADLDSYGLPYRVDRSAYVRFTVADPAQVARFADAINKSWHSCSADSAEPFGCCNDFFRCSEAGACIKPDRLMVYGCQYRRNLLKGLIFYGPRRNV